jgi:filamentous hemagglutinin
MRARKQRIPKILEAALAIGASLAGSGAGNAGTALPVPCAAGACGKTGPSQFVTSGSASAVSTQNAMTVMQTTNSAILNWSSFNIGANGSVTFNQPSSSAIALNRIFQASPSQILGHLSANGQVYLVNLNGFIFGSTSTVNVGSLLVSSLPLALDDANFAKGILSPLQSGKPVFDATLDPLAPGVGRTSVLDANGNPVVDANGIPLKVQVVVQPGAQLTAADQGRILLAGQTVTNGGSLTAHDGQVVLAAGTQVYLQADSDPGLRGLIVEVDGNGTATNQLGGLLSSPRGNITMVGLAVNQDGRISATTAVSANGSIRLEAASGATATQSPLAVVSNQGGTLTIGPQSEMDILPELSSSATAVSTQTQYPSMVTLLGEQVILQGGSITAPGGALTAIAAMNPAFAAVAADSTDPTKIHGVTAAPDPNARLHVDAGTTIDLSGSSASLPMSANLVSAQLRSSELADDPTQRNGPLHGLTVYFDKRNPPPAQLANLQGEIDAVPENIAQLTEHGGNAVFQSEGDIVFAKGASLNVSGGASTYAGGVLQTSYLVGANGQLYPIASANPLASYVGVVNPTFSQTYNKWGVQDVLPEAGLSSYQPGYVQGAPAGSVQFAASNMVLQGSLQGSAVNGLYQRTPSTAVQGGQLTIGIPGGITPVPDQPLEFLSPAVRLTATPLPIAVGDDTSLSGRPTLDLPVSYLTSSGFTSTQIYSDYGVLLSAGTPLLLPSGSTLNVNAARVDVLSSITDPAGMLDFQNVFTMGSQTPETSPRAGVYLGDNVTLDVRGLWTNDMMPASIMPALAQTWQNGGSINLGVSSVGAMLSLGNDNALRASGGAWIDAKGTLTAGTGGSISMISNAIGGGLDVGNNLAVDGFGVNGAAGGTFTLAAPRIEISNGSGSWTMAQQVDDSVATGATVAAGGVFQIYSSLFSNYGFETINLAATGVRAAGSADADVLSVDPGTSIAATVGSLKIGPNASLRPSAATLDGIAAATTLAPYRRPAANVNLSALEPSGANNAGSNGGTAAGDLSIGANASIVTDAGGSITLTSLDSIVVDGVLRAPGGTVALQILSPTVINKEQASNNYTGYVIDGANYSAFDPGFLPNQRIELGAGIIDVSGTFVAKPSVSNLDLGTLYAGGTVNLLADRGAVVTDAGSLISIAGASAPLDVQQASGSYAHEVAASAAGSMSVHSGEAVSLHGGLAAAAGSGGTSGAAAAGSLDVELTRSEPWWLKPGPVINASFNQGPLTVELMPTLPSTVPPSAAGSNLAQLGTAQLAQSGVDALRIEAGDTLLLSGDVNLALGRQLIVDSPAIAATGGGHANLSAPYLEVGYELTGNPSPNAKTATLGSGVLSFAGAEIDLVGNTVFQGTSDVRFVSSGDLVLRGAEVVSGGGTPTGSLSVDGNLTLDAARIYPTTGTNFTIDAGAPNAQDPTQSIVGNVTIGQTGANPGTPLSAGGMLTISADTLTSTGTLEVPFGTIALDARTSLTLGDGSLTSVSGAGLTIPYGETQFGGQQWIYDGYSLQTISGIPTRTVNLTSPSVTLTKQATVDLTGGGDLSAFEWVPGPGGSKDLLANGAVPGLYAILPSTMGQAAPQDLEAGTGSTILPGQSVYLSGGAGLAAGTYPLLPARYALLPGAYLIQVEPSYQSPSAGPLGALADGTPVVAGFFSYGSTGLHQSPGYSGFAIYPGSYGGQLAGYDINLASNFFSSAASLAGSPRPNLPADAGSLSLSIDSAAGLAGTLDIAGLVRTAAASGGIAAPIAISATDLFIGTPSGAAPSDAVSVAGSVLQSWHPGSLLLGGIFGPSSADGTADINVSASTVTVGAGTALTADQIVLVANQSIEVQNGASLQSTSAATGIAPSTPPTVQSVTLTGVGAGSSGTPGFLAVSDLNWLIPARMGGAISDGAATVAIDSGTSIGSRGSLSIDGAGGVTINGSLTGAGAAWSLGSSSIAFAASGSSPDALIIGPGLLAALGTAGAVRLGSTGSIDLYTPVTLGVGADGNPTFTALTLAAASLNNMTGAGGSAGATASQFGGQTVTLEGVNGSGVSGSPATIAGPTGATLTFTAGELDVGPNTLAVNGFATTQANVSSAVVGRGTGLLSVDGDFSIAAAAVTVATAADTQISATGALAIAPSAAGNIAKVPSLLGGELHLSGGSVSISGTVAAPSGIVKVTAMNGDVSLAPGATISTAGTVVGIGNQMVGTPGGIIAVNTGGNLSLSPGALLNVAGAGEAAGGAISLNAVGSTSVGATLGGSGGAATNGGSFSLETGSLTVSSSVGTNALDALAQALTAGGFTNAIDVRVQHGDLTLDAANTLSANSVTLTADTGGILIGGQISAPSGALRGMVSIFGGTGVDLTASGVLRADRSGTSGLGGTIEIGTGQLVADQAGVLDEYNSATITLDPNSTISAAGAAGMGTLLLRAPAVVTNNDVAINSLPTNTAALGQIIVEPVLPFNTTAFSSATAPLATDFQLVQQSVGNYMAGAGPAISTRLAHGAAPLMVEAGVEIIAPGDLILPALDLSSWRFNGTPIDLTVRAAGDLNVSGTVSDGFATNTRVGRSTQSSLLSGPSASICLVAGADLASADPLAVIATPGTPLTTGTLTIAGSTVVRTGTGDLDLIAANNIELSAGSSAYTAGVPDTWPGQTSANAGIDSKLGTPQSSGGDVYGVQVPGTTLLMSFPSGGGNLVVRAGADIVNSSQTAASPVPNWQLREGGTQYTPAAGGGLQTTPVEWGVNLAAYDWNFGTLGGGDLRIAAGGNAVNVSAAAADSLLPQPLGAPPQYVRSGGLSFSTGGDIESAQIFLADGTGTVTAGGGLLPSANGSSTPNVGSAFYLQSSAINVTARLKVAVDGIFNPTALPQPVSGDASVGNTTSRRPLDGYFYSYSDDSALSLLSVAGDISLGAGGAGAASALLGSTEIGLLAGQTTQLSTFPASLYVQATSGNITLGNGIGSNGLMTLYPAAQGQIDLLAAQDIDGNETGGNRFIMSDAVGGSFPTVSAPFLAQDNGLAAFGGDLHSSDATQALVIAGGSINELSLSIPKAAQVVAGKDIVDLNYAGQNLSAGDQTLISAGRDIAYDSPNGDNYGVSVGGPGQLNVLAGRSVSLGRSVGITTTGNLLNPNLPTAQGADLTIATGLGTAPDFADFLTKVIEPSTAYQAELVSYVESVQGSAGLTLAMAEAAFQEFSTDQQRPLIDKVFFNELLLSGRADNTTPGAGFTQGYAAIDALFPDSRTGFAGAVAGAYIGDLTLDFSQIYTLSGGNISLIVPGGSIDVGLAVSPTSGAKSASQLGIVAQGAGSVDIYTKGDVNVNTSRIFTLGGGNIEIWSNEGSIDAGLGAKTAISAPPPSVTINSDGTVSLNLQGAAAGSGIRTIQTNPDQALGSVDLIAPVGTVNAGDAGIGAAGNINIAAREVVGLDNIQFGGTSTGVPSQVSNIGASLSGASSAASSATNTATSAAANNAAEKEAAAPLAQNALSWLDVFVTGLGEENCKPDDIDCLQRQKRPTR